MGKIRCFTHRKYQTGTIVEAQLLVKKLLRSAVVLNLKMPQLGFGN